MSFVEGPGYRHVHALVRDVRERCWLIVESEDVGPYAVYEARPEEAASILGECFGFEYYLVAKDLSWLVCENHHGRIIGCGASIEDAIRRIAE